MKTIDNYDFKGKKALIRVDFNVPLDNDFKVTDGTRIHAALPTINKVIEDGGAVILMSHLGRPKGVDLKYSLKHIVTYLSDKVGQQVKFSEDCVGEVAEKAAKQLQMGEILLLENLRFHEEEKKGDSDFARELSQLADVWINDAFGTAHRAHASTAIIANYFSQDKMFGYVIEKELQHIDQMLENTQHPFTAIVGGSKVSSKITIIENILGKVDNLIIGGGMTYTFIKAQGGKIGSSVHEDDYLELSLSLLEKAKKLGTKIYLPIDNVVADAFDESANTQIVPIDEVEEGWSGLDIGSDSINLFKEVIANSATILWNGPVGVFEMKPFETGTKLVAEAIAQATKTGAFSLIGGGDSVAAVTKYNLTEEVSYISTGGGALLEYIEGKKLPGIEAVRSI